jgi:hypothetical protein
MARRWRHAAIRGGGRLRPVHDHVLTSFELLVCAGGLRWAAVRVPLRSRLLRRGSQRTWMCCGRGGSGPARAKTRSCDAPRESSEQRPGRVARRSVGGSLRFVRTSFAPGARRRWRSCLGLRKGLLLATPPAEGAFRVALIEEQGAVRRARGLRIARECHVGLAQCSGDGPRDVRGVRGVAGGVLLCAFQAS